MYFSLLHSFVRGGFFALALTCGFFSLSEARADSGGVPVEEFLSRTDKARLDRQAADLYRKLDKVAAPLGRSVVYVCRDNHVMALGTVVGSGRVLTKWSDLTRINGNILVVSGDAAYPTQVLGGSAEHDLVLLEVPGLKAPALDFAQNSKGGEGDFLLTVMPGGVAGEFGVVSVAARSLRDQDLPYMGVIADMSFSGRQGARVGEVDPRSGAKQAGLQAGDLILKLDQFSLDGPLAMRTALKDKKPGDSVKTTFQRGKSVHEVAVVLGNRPASSPQFSEQRLETMNAMGNPMSLRRRDFPWVIQSDMTLDPFHAGAPVVNADGRLVGLALSRAGRTETYILPADLIAEALSSGTGEDTPQEMERKAVIVEESEDQIKDRDARQEKMRRELQEMQKRILEAEIVEEE